MPNAKMQKQKASQIQMGESIAILFVFFILIAFGFVFYFRVMASSAQVDVEENIQLKAVGVAQKASFLPELQCSKENVRDENCIDILKLEYFDDLVLRNKLYYYDIFSFSDVRVESKFPDMKIYQIYKSTPAEYKDKLSTFIPISLYNATEDSYGFGILIVEVYST